MKILLIQMNSKLDPKVNIDFIEKCIKENSSVDAVFLPEVFYSMSNGDTPTPYLLNHGNEHYLHVASIAKKYRVALLGGSAASELDGNIVNRAWNFDANGELIDIYDKQNLFSVNLEDKNKLILDEASVYTAGNTPKIIDYKNWKIGLSICFDLRFPELYRNYFSMGAEVMTVASAFTIPTGRAHWETLLRSRAIENQSYVIAANQVGVHNEKISTYGHSLVVDPWGEVLVNLKDEVGCAVVELDKNRVNEIRKRMNIGPK